MTLDLDPNGAERKMTEGKMDRTEQHIQGYRRAAKDAIEWLHERARSMNDQRAAALLHSAAFSLGVDFARRDVIPSMAARKARREAARKVSTP